MYSVVDLPETSCETGGERLTSSASSKRRQVNLKAIEDSVRTILQAVGEDP